MTGLTSVIGLLALLIAYQQWRLNRERLRLELFEKRYSVYKATREYVANVSLVGDPEASEQWKFLSKTSDACFLFKDDVIEYLQSVRDKSDELVQHVHQKDTEGEDRERHEQEVAGLCCWFQDQFVEDALPTVFAPYLRFQDLEDPVVKTGRRILQLVLAPLRRNDQTGR